MTILKVDHLWFDYNSGPVLKDVCLTAKPSMVSGLLGPNASGKTTLFKCMNGIMVTGYNRSDCLVIPRTNAAGDVMF